jgi:hypothetical protein
MGARSFESGRWEGAGSIIPVYDPLSKASWVPWECNGEEALQPIGVLMQLGTSNGVRHHHWLEGVRCVRSSCHAVLAY